MIVVFDTAEERSVHVVNANVTLTTINCEGMYRYWSADSLGEFRKWWWDEEYDGPANDDEVTEFIVEGKNIFAENKIEIFYDIVKLYNFDEKEVM